MGGSRRSLRKGKVKVRVGLQGGSGAKKTKTNSRMLERALQSFPAGVLDPSVEVDPKARLVNNYQTLNLATDLNFKSGRNRKRALQQLPKEGAEQAQEGKGEGEEEGEGNAEREDSEGEAPHHDEVRAALGLKRRHGPSKPLPRLTTMQRLHVGRLIRRYDQDYEAMARDRHLNAMQHSAGALKLLCRRFQHYKEALPQEEK
eukprot:TRINITY_DN3012_c0_g1_i1.p1 TRINITY_DN3012_c0_g1~~TRINITY_DN3012_c0_g1_i1.p1  ORF type:complete len:202 (-),score=59.23 TRINITY_DN3012_c0_g1_i1:1400-2005(-)